MGGFKSFGSAASRICDVAPTTGNQMDMQMRDGLACCRSIIDAYVESVVGKLNVENAFLFSDDLE
jgi:hypothetical protein